MSNHNVFIGPYAESLKRGLEDAAAGRLVDKGSFAEYVAADPAEVDRVLKEGMEQYKNTLHALAVGDEIRSLDHPEETIQDQIDRMEWEIQSNTEELVRLYSEKRELGHVDTYANKRGK